MTQTFTGKGVSPGVVLGEVYVVPRAESDGVSTREPEVEGRAFDAAVATSIAQLEDLAGRLRAEGNGEEAGILDAQVLMLRDPMLTGAVATRIARGESALGALRETGTEIEALFSALDDPYMAARAADVADATARVARALSGVGAIRLDHPCILVADDLTPSETAGLDRSMVLGIATARGSTTSHTAILARSFGIPAVVGLGTAIEQLQDDAPVLLDGTAGTVVLDPTSAQQELAEVEARARHILRADLRRERDLPAETRDGHRITLAANIGSPAELPAALEAGAEGIGLFRSEFLFAGRESLPDEGEQMAIYRTVLEAMAPHTVVIRTLDVGGDKPLPYLPAVPEANPFLGVRGIRHAFAHEEIFRVQLRALFRASVHGKLAIMFPMIAERDELTRALRLVRSVQGEVGGTAEIGIMIETPAAALIAARLAPQVAFFSAGTNDLTQYTLAIDRGNERVASLYQPLHPAVLRLLAETAAGAHQFGRWAGVCGEMAGEEHAIPLLLGLGFDELSMSPERIGPARRLIRSLRLAQCRDLAVRALECSSAVEVEGLVDADLGGGGV